MSRVPRRRRAARSIVVVALAVAAIIAVYLALRAIPGPVRPTLGPPSTAATTR